MPSSVQLKADILLSWQPLLLEYTHCEGVLSWHHWYDVAPSHCGWVVEGVDAPPVWPFPITFLCSRLKGIFFHSRPLVLGLWIGSSNPQSVHQKPQLCQLVVKPQLPRIDQDCRGVVTLGLAENWRWMLKFLATHGWVWGLITHVLALLTLPADYLRIPVGWSLAVLSIGGRSCNLRYLQEHRFWREQELGPEVTVV